MLWEKMPYKHLQSYLSSIPLLKAMIQKCKNTAGHLGQLLLTGAVVTSDWHYHHDPYHIAAAKAGFFCLPTAVITQGSCPRHPTLVTLLQNTSPHLTLVSLLVSLERMELS